MHRPLAALVALVLATFLAAPRARAQDLLVEPEPLTLDASASLGTHPDEGLMIAGATVFLLGVTMGVAVLMPIEVGHCVEPGDTASLPGDHGFPMCSQAPLAAIPFAHILGGGMDSIIAGPILLVAEVIGLFTFIGGAAHHHPNGPAAPRAGEITLTGVPGADVGLGLSIRF